MATIKISADNELIADAYHAQNCLELAIDELRAQDRDGVSRATIDHFLGQAMKTIKELRKSI